MWYERFLQREQIVILKCNIFHFIARPVKAHNDGNITSSQMKYNSIETTQRNYERKMEKLCRWTIYIEREREREFRKCDEAILYEWTGSKTSGGRRAQFLCTYISEPIETYIDRFDTTNCIQLFLFIIIFIFFLLFHKEHARAFSSHPNRVVHSTLSYIRCVLSYIESNFFSLLVVWIKLMQNLQNSYFFSLHSIPFHTEFASFLRMPCFSIHFCLWHACMHVCVSVCTKATIKNVLNTMSFIAAFYTYST